MLKYLVILLVLSYTNGDPAEGGEGNTNTDKGDVPCDDNTWTSEAPEKRPAEEHREDYTYTPGVGAHKLHTKRANWENALKTCEGENGHLAIINSDDEALAITKIFNETKSDGLPDANVAFLGFHRCKEDKFFTIHGKSITEAGFEKWEEKEPNNNNKDQNCGAIYRNGKLHDVDCKVALAFFCELPL